MEYVKALALAKMDPQQLLAAALVTFAENADKIGTLHLGPDTLANLLQEGRA